MDAEQLIGGATDHGADIAVLDGDATPAAPDQGQPVGRRQFGESLHGGVEGVLLHKDGLGRRTSFKSERTAAS